MTPYAYQRPARREASPYTAIENLAGVALLLAVPVLGAVLAVMMRSI